MTGKGVWRMETFVILNFCLLVRGRVGNENWLTVPSRKCWKSTGQPPRWPESLQNWGARTKARTADRHQLQNQTGEVPMAVPLTMDTTDHGFFTLLHKSREKSLLFSICSCYFTVLGGTVWADGPRPYLIPSLTSKKAGKTSITTFSGSAS